MVGYKASLFYIITLEWLVLRSYGDFVQGLITSPPVKVSIVILADRPVHESSIKSSTQTFLIYTFAWTLKKGWYFEKITAIS